MYVWTFFSSDFWFLQGHPSSEVSSTTTGGSDESTSSSPGREEDVAEDDRDLGESEDEADKPITHVEAPSRRRRSSCTPPSALYSWKEVTLGNRLVIEFYFAMKKFLC